MQVPLYRGLTIGLFLVTAVTRVAPAQVIHVTSATAAELAALDRGRVVVLLPGGILEEHGPYLPVFADGYLNERLTDTLAAILSARTGRSVVVFPAVPLGNSGANDIGGRFSYPGTFAVRSETLRAVFMDWADDLGLQGFRWIFVLHLHGAPNHSRALEEAGDYFRDTYGGRMVHLAGLQSVFGTLDGAKSAAARAADGLPIHAGMDETSLLLYLRPDLVRPGFARAPDQADSTMDGLIARARSDTWPGYFGAPRLGTAAHGQRIWTAMRDSSVAAALRVLAGADPARSDRFATLMEESPPDVRLDAASRRAEEVQAQRQRAWLVRHHVQ
jgi:creatinine amidohydrolase/Fe(II)-dependent formamide hydrolase-like protein